MYLKKTPNLNGWIRLSIVDTYYDEVLKDIGRVTDIDFGKRIRTLGEIKKVLAKTKKQKKHHENLTKQKTRQALYLLSLTGILYLFSCKSQDI